MRKKVTREIEIKVCDFCGEEAERVDTCSVCGREGCLRRLPGKDKKLEHWAFHVANIYDYERDVRGSGYVCTECGGRVMPISEFLGKLCNIPF